MKNWMKIHQILLAALVFAVLGFLIVYFLVLSPKKQELEEVRSEVSRLQERLRGSSWPLDADRLARFLTELEKECKGDQKSSALTAHSAAALHRANATFLP